MSILNHFRTGHQYESEGTDGVSRSRLWTAINNLATVALRMVVFDKDHTSRYPVPHAGPRPDGYTYSGDAYLGEVRMWCAESATDADAQVYLGLDVDGGEVWHSIVHSLPAPGSTEKISYSLETGLGVNPAVRVTSNVTVLDLTASVTIATPYVAGRIPDGRSFSAVLVVRQDDTGGRVVTWGTDNVRWPGGVALANTTTPNAIDVFQLFTFDGGTTWLVVPFGLGFA